MSMWSRIFSRRKNVEAQRMSLDEYAQLFNLSHQWYPHMLGGTNGDGTEEPPHEFSGYVNGIYKRNGIVFACMEARRLVFSQARFQWQHIENGRPTDLFDSSELRLLHRPWPNARTGDLLSRALQDVDLAGNHYVVRENGRLRRLRPDWVTIILTEDPSVAVKSDIALYEYRPGGTGEPVRFLPEEIAHWAPIPDPVAQFRGMSWLTPVIREIQADGAATDHKNAYFRNAATPNIAVSLPAEVTEEQFQGFVKAMDATHKGTSNAYKTLYLGGGADVEVIGADLSQMDFKRTQGAGETRIAAAARIPPVIAGLSEGLAGSSLNQGNFQAAKDMFADGLLHPLWSSLSSAYETILGPPPNSRLWYDVRDVEFLRRAKTEQAEIIATRARVLTRLVQDGFTVKSSVRFIETDDWGVLEHTGLLSVQLQPPETAQREGDEAAPQDQPKAGEE